MANIINECPNENGHNKTFNEKLIFRLHPIKVEIAPDEKEDNFKLSFDLKSHEIAFNVMEKKAQGEANEKSLYPE